MRLPAPSRLAFVFCAGAALLLPIRGFSADIAGANTKTNTLKPAERNPEPVLASASDEPQKAMLKFRVPAGFTTSVWASEPMLGNPVAFALDEQGRAFVAETFRYRTSVLDIRHYMFMLEDDLASRSTDDRIAFTKKNFPTDWQKLEIETEVVRLVQDKSGDGKADTSSVYAAGMNTLLDGINSGVLAYNGRVWCTNMPNLWLFSGLTPDGQAEKRESLSFGYGVRYSFTGHDMHGLAMGPDGRLYFSFGDRGAHVQTREGKTLSFPDEGAVFRCELDGSNMEVVHRGLRNPQELAFDNHGNLFTGDNDCDMGDRERWVYVVEGGDSGWRVGWQHPPLGKDRNMWLLEKMWETRKPETPAYILSPILNIPDGPSGLVHYPGTGLPAEYEDAFFVCGFKGSSARSAISWWKVKEDGASFEVDKSPAPFVDSVQATDVDFGPDSRIYFTEWGEGWEGTGRGRIFQMEHTAAREAQAAQIAEVKALIGGELLKKSSSDLAALLGHKDQRIRLRAQWALAEKTDAVEQFAAVAQKGAEPLARLHAIWGLGHVARLAGYREAAAEARAAAQIIPLLADADAEVRAQTAKVLGDARVREAQAAVVKALKDQSARVRFFAAQALGKIGGEGAAGHLVELLKANADADEYIRHACVQALVNLGDASAISAAARDGSKSVRLGALLALRKQGKPEVAQFLADAEPSLVKEAARAINDTHLAAAAGELAQLIAKPVKDEALMLRVLNANFRTGTPETAAALVAYALDATQPEPLRVEALALLSTWAKPFPRDRVTGNFAPLPERDAAPVIAALKPALPKLLGTRSASLTLATVEAVSSLRISDAGPALLVLLSNKDSAPKAREAALKTIAALDEPHLADAIRIAVLDKDPAVRVEASAMLGRLNPDEAATQLSLTFDKAAVPEKKQIITALGDLKGAAADKVIVSLLAEARAGKIPAEAHLELLEAAEKRQNADVKSRLSAWQNSIPATDPLAKYAYALVGGDRAQGEKLFKEHAVAQCARCHKVQGVGGDAGPDLTGIAAKKDRRYLLESIVLPNATIAEGFQTVMVTTHSGDIKAGIVREENADSVTLQMPIPDAPKDVVKKADIKLRENAPSGMPPGMGELLTKRELRDLVEYVVSLK